MKSIKGNWYGLKKWFKIKATLGTAWRLLRDKRMPRRNKYIFLGLTIAYFVLPMDILPDYILLFGWLDDLAIITLLLKGFIFSAPQELRALSLLDDQSRKENYKHKQDR